ncbi:uncharacterized protein PHACADRAFT_251412 [Phanerochaete carnosa HHB-10118-sp]|uniref:DUF6533 domain-containing protein n=1 Tax=Phanerochaete carnosa (strain HHB-10118-sp) TaxID=650164 RepID=K5W1C1_PHACS|nr:uncharacterized protein PHACADRAFT_251412 [Phanerochaete carnosa HHB-10118-sp]EKM57653.1 hypothetical protein PHACADRAFT_251412 [Phanerochaete carnosa HHB-10118-sp]
MAYSYHSSLLLSILFLNMSAQSNQALVQAYSQLIAENYTTAATTCLVIYELLITIGDEVNIVWKRPVTARAVLLGSVRWCVLVSIILQLVPYTPKNMTNSCTPIGVLSEILILIGFVQTAIFAALRVYAIWSKSYVWSLPVFVLSMAPFVTNLIGAAMSKYIVIVYPLLGVICTSEYPFSERTTNIFVYTTRGSLILADLIVLVLTWIKTFGNWWRARGIDVKMPLTVCLLRDVLLAVNVAQLLTYNSSAVRPPYDCVADG